jgi:hypothetical protein
MKVSSRASSGLSPKRVVCVTNAIDSDSNVDRLGTESTSSINGKDVNYPSVSQVYFIHRRTNSDVGKKCPAKAVVRVSRTHRTSPQTQISAANLKREYDMGQSGILRQLVSAVACHALSSSLLGIRCLGNVELVQSTHQQQ